MSRRRLIGLGALGLVGILWGSTLVPVREERLRPTEVASVTWVDRHGRELGREPGPLGTFAEPAPLSEISPHLVNAMLAAEDRRFFSHGGLDVLAVARAAWQNLTALQVVSGGSTLTQQLARLLETEAALLAGDSTPPRGLVQKLREAHLALRLERSFDKQRILEAFLNRAPFGNNTVGAQAAARAYFEAAASRLSLAQAAYLAAIPKGPTLYNPLRNGSRTAQRQRHILARMRALGFIDDGQLARALGEPVEPRRESAQRLAMHAVQLAREGLGARPHGRVALTIDLELTRAVRDVLEEEVARVYNRGGRSAAAVVLDHRSGEVLAAVGSAFEDNPLWGEFSAVTSVRQPGSALKPFLYAAAFAQGLTPASLAADIKRPFPDTWGVFMPENYDHRFHGPVRLREALAQSLNVAAVDVLYRVGLERFTDVLAAAGLTTLDRRPAHYGLGLVLGSGGVRLIDLTNAYAGLARGGVRRPWRVLHGPPPGEATRFLDPRVAHLVGDVLSDGNARIPQFGEASVLSTPYWSAVKTGTSKGYRDNWTLGYTENITVGVWVGDPTGRPMREVSGVEGAGAIWRRIMNHVTEGRSRRPEPPDGLERVEICSVSGLARTPACEGGRSELFVKGTAPGRSCDWHRHALVDPADGGLVPPGCSVAGARREARLLYPSPYDAWALDAERAAPVRYSSRCPAPRPLASAKLTLLSPAPTEVVRIDPDAPRRSQALPLHAELQGAYGPVSFLVDGEVIGTVEAPHRMFWPVAPGEHRIQARLAGTEITSPEHRVVVR